MPTYNAALYLRTSIDSILEQTFTDFDLYIYDDCSSDNTAIIVSSYNNPRVFYRRNLENLGIAKTLNKGLEELLPQYEYIGRMDADDYAFPERFEKQIEFMQSNVDIAVCGTQGYWLENLDDNPSKGWVYPINPSYINYYLLFAATFGHSSVVLRAKSFRDSGLRYDESIVTCEDWDLWIRVAKMGKMANLPDFLMKYRIVENSNHRDTSTYELHLQERSKILAKYWRSFDIPLSEQEIFEFYYSVNTISKTEFKQKIKLLIQSFNSLYSLASQQIASADKNELSYLLARKVLSYWKRAQKSRSNATHWLSIITSAKFRNKLKLVKNLMQ